MLTSGTIGVLCVLSCQVLCVRVPRSRYLPVKSTSDLFLVQSNLYSVSRGSLIMNPARSGSPFHLIVCASGAQFRE